jgi:hypothetical protein
MILFWLEDRKDLVIGSYEIVAKKLGFKRAMRQTFGELKQILDEKRPLIEHTYFVLDVLLAGQRNLASIGLPDVDTGEGTTAGIKFAEHFLLSANSPYQKCPICFLTELEVDESIQERIRSLRPEPPIFWIRKHRRDGVEEFERFLSGKIPTKETQE